MTNKHLPVLAVTALFVGFCSSVQAGPVTVAAYLAGTYRIHVGTTGPPVNIDGSLIGANGQPVTPEAGADFTITLAKHSGFVIITSKVSGMEPTVEHISGPGTIGVTPNSPGESGYESLIYLGSSTATSLGGSVVSVSILGGPSVSYVTNSGDTFQTIFNKLIPALDSDGVDAFQSGNSLVVLSNITNQDTLAGAVSFVTTDPVLSFGIQAGTVPEPSSLILLSIAVAALGGHAWYRRDRNDVPMKVKCCRP